MTSFKVPNLYKCFFSQEVMQDPVVILRTGQVCDRTSLTQDSSQTIVPLPGLKTAIHQYLQIYQTNQPEEIFQTKQVEETVSSNVSSDLTITTQVYKEKIQDVKKQAQLVSDANQVLQNEKEQLNPTCLKFQSNKFKMMADEFGKLDVNGNANSIMNSRNCLLESWNIIGEVLEQGCKKLMNLYKARYIFEKQLACLEFKEKELVNLREGLSKILESFEIQPVFTTEFEASSKKYRGELSKIDANKFQELVKTGFIEDVCVNIETSQVYEDIKIQGEVTLKNITFTNAKKGARYVRFIIPNINTKITISGCKFEGTGVIIRRPEDPKRGDVVVRNTEFKNVPGQALSIENCNKCIIEHVKVQGSGYSGVILDLTEGTLEDVHLQDCGQCGIVIQEGTKSINISNSSICNCQFYGLYIANINDSFHGTNVTFENNTKGNVRGNFRQN